jgi:hypothetical protein
VREQMDAGLSRDEIVAVYLARKQAAARASGLDDTAVLQYTLSNPPAMSVDGLMRYWQKKR